MKSAESAEGAEQAENHCVSAPSAASAFTVCWCGPGVQYHGTRASDAD
jgi:hypothetical protein